MEVWKRVKGYENYLTVSNQGRVKSFMRSPDGKILKTQTDKKGYQRLTCTIEGEKVRFKVHRLVAEHFIDNPDNKPQVNHKDGNKRNNSVSNLEWVSNRENCRHAIKAGLWDSVIKGARRENEKRKKAIIGYYYTETSSCSKYFGSISEAEMTIGSRHIVDVLKGKRSHAKGWTFRYVEGGDANAS